ncbi:MAG: hypothetical protein ACK41T_01440 [Pseudobdellovibrio sp.]
MKKFKCFIFTFAAISMSSIYAVASAPKVGRSAAAKYFQSKGVTQANNSEADYSRQRYPSSIDSLSAQDHYLAVGISSYMNSASYKWGTKGSQDDVGKAGFDITYRLSQDYALFDTIAKISYNDYKVAGEKASKMSFLYGLTFPDAGSQFPLYFGLVAGPGIFFKQLSDESSISFDYQLFAGLRLFNLFENTGFFVEGGLKNHINLTSDGQLNGTFISAGAVFTF